MNGSDGHCQQLQDELDRIQADLRFWRNKLRTASPSERPEIVAKINELSVDEHVTGLALADCLNPPHPPNIAISGVELTQATQFFKFNGNGSGNATDNSVPLVANKDLILRVYVNYFTLDGTVTGSVSYSGHPDLAPLNGPLPGMRYIAIDRGNPNHTLNFRVPAAHCVGTISFVVRVFDPVHAADPTYSSSDTIFVNFVSVPNPRVHGVLLHYTGKDASGRTTDIPAPTTNDFINTLSWANRVYPISAFNFTGYNILNFSGDLSDSSGAGCGKGWNDLLTTLNNMASASNSHDRYVALLPTGVPNNGYIGCGGGGPVAAGYTGDGPTLAQEIGHAFGRAHAPCGNPGNPDPSYPIYDSYPKGSIGEYGFDSATSTVFNPSSTFDYMSYCGPVWTSPYSYLGLKDAITSADAVKQPNRAEVRDVAREYLYLNYRMDRDGQVELGPSFHLPGHTSTVMHREYGLLSPASCELIDADGQVVTFHHCHLSDPEQDPDGSYLSFREAIPWDPQVTTIRFLRSGAVVHSIELPERSPEVSIQQPRHNELRKNVMTVEWRGQHPEQPLTYLLRYSHDGGSTWRAVATDLTGPPHAVNLDFLPGGQQCVFQVVASAGIRTTVVETEPFAVPQKPRQAYILSPEPSASFAQGEPVVLRGGGFSPDFGTTEFEDVVWTSNVDGVIGVGHEVVAYRLSSGQHKINLSFPDGVGGEASTSVFIRVERERSGT
jgi:hypothetical protein